jgi:hypothetical protein
MKTWFVVSIRKVQKLSLF